jgi:hypothetical protein
MSVLDLAVDGFDWTIDALRGVCGFPPLPPELVKLRFDASPTVRVATGLRLETRRTFYAFVRIEQGGLSLFEGSPPRNGSIGVLPLTGALMRVHVRLESRHTTARHGSCVTEAIFEPLPNGPVIERFDVPAKVPFGGSVACAWHVPAAERVHLAVIEDGKVDDRLGPPSGQMLLEPALPGRLLLRLTAENSWGQTMASRSVEVIAPKLRIALPRPAVQAGHPGDDVRFEWRVTGARSVWLVAPDSDRPQRVGEDSFLFVTLGWRPAEFQLIARGYGGAERSAVLRAVPHPYACLGE